ncbi:hypothetical protein [Escherichia sp. E5028]|uniref:hypothetical protein n=1 Tax=Escherichia sp. E5028 TaxID=2044602 RepID=UPI001436A620|nr:hypothetical protein [Escherichia sp. E5028]
MARSGGAVCKKIKLKNFPDPETAGGCGVAPFLSAKDLFCRHITIPAQRYNSVLLYLVTKLGLLLKG